MYPLSPLKLVLNTAMLVALATPATYASRAMNTGNAAGPPPGLLTKIQLTRHEARVCCKTRRRLALLLPSKCKSAGGKPVDERHCRRLISKRICCKLVTGKVSFRSDFDCSWMAGTPVDKSYCLEPVCCRNSEKSGYQSGVSGTPRLGPLRHKMVQRTQCTQSPHETIVDDNMCKNVCCRVPLLGSTSHEYRMLPRGDCKEDELLIVPIIRCKASEHKKIKRKH